MFAANQNLRPLLPNPSVEFHIEKRRAKWRDQKRRQRQRKRKAALEAVGVTVLVRAEQSGHRHGNTARR